MQMQPDYSPPKPASVKGQCEVVASGSHQRFTVNLDTMTCDCAHGAPWRQDKREKWKPQNLCNHKLKAIASLCVTHPKDITMRDYYDENLGRRTNAFEAVSAMHKEMRKGDVTQALYWATMMIPHRGKHGVVAYMRNILFEETRDLALAKYILKVSAYGTSVTLLDMQRAVARFTIAPKKWELPWRYDIFLNEMRGYRSLAKDYGYEVAKGKDIVDKGATPKLQGTLQEGFTDANLINIQIGLKGWFKSKSSNHDEMKLDIFNFLTEILNSEKPNGFQYDKEYALDLHKLLIQRLRNHGGVGYHELNALCDALCGEPGNDPRCTVSLRVHKQTLNFPKERRIKLGVMRNVPLYAHDNHTWGGKSKMRTYGAVQLLPGAEQTNLDFRLCGAYMGVAWRTLAYKQRATIDCKWGDVSWSKPNWLWKHLDSMWY